MALAVTHVILTIILLDLARHYLFGKKNFPRYLLVVGGIAGLFPDIDIILTWFYQLLTGSSLNLHRLFTHNLLFPVILLAFAFFFHYQKNLKWAKLSYVVSFGWFFHLLLDCFYGGPETFLQPLWLFNPFCPFRGISSLTATYIDAIILVLWLLHEELHQKIKDYF